MSDYQQELQELEREVKRLMQQSAKQPGHKSILFADALKKILTAKKSNNPQDVMNAYQIVIDLGYPPSMRETDNIVIVIDTLAHYSGQFIAARYRGIAELVIQATDLVEIDDKLIQHYVHKWDVQTCCQRTPDNNEFWQAWGVVYELAIQYRCEVQAQVIERLFTVYGRALNIRKVG